MQTIDQILQPKWMIPVDPARSVFTGYGVAIDKGQIIAVEPVEKLATQYQPKQRLALQDHALMPGFVNAHTHAAMTLLRGYADDLPLMEWLSEHIWPAETKWVGVDFVKAGTDLAILEMIRSGTTCFNDMYFYPDTTVQCAQAAGIRACVGMILIDMPTAWAQDADEYIRKGLQLHDQVRHSPLISTAFAPHAPYSVSDDALSRVATLSQEMDCQVHIHLHETGHEVEDSQEKHGTRPIERLYQLGLLNPNLIAVHMTQLLAEEIELIKKQGAHVVHCPESNLKLASGFCPTATLQETGINVAIGTDGASSNNDLDMLSEMKSASLLSKGVSHNPSAFDAYAALEAATLCGARALALDHLTGSIEVGKKADLVAIDLSDCASQPVYHPVSQIVYCASRSQISHVWVAGKNLLNKGEWTTMDADGILARARVWRQKITAN